MPLGSVTKTVSGEPTLLSIKLHVPNHAQPAQLGSPRASSLRFRNLRLDPTRALEPVRKKLTSIEAQRVKSVFDDTIRRVQIVTLLPYIIQDLERFSVSLGSELVELLKRHSVIISSYDDITQELDSQLKRRAAMAKRQKSSEDMAEDEIAEESEEAGDDNEEQEESAQSERGSSAHSSTDSQLEATIRNLSLVAQQMSHSVRNILRAFILNPLVMAVVIDRLDEREAECRSLIKYLQDLREILMHRLLTTPSEERDRITYLTEIAKRERQNAAIIEKLAQELKVKNDDKEQEIFKKNETIKRLQLELHQIEKFSEEHIRRVRADAEKQEAADEKNSEGKCNKLQVEVTQFHAKLSTSIVEHREREQELRNKKFKIVSEVDNWIMKYDQELGDRQDEFEEIDAIYTEEKKQLRELEERFKILEKEYLGILATRLLTREKREKEERIMAMRVKAAATIQAVWRSFKVRKALKHRKKKGPKKKKGKPGKKK
ncbi:hypothetical protein ACOMHN_038978 [Nucella lapillus]